jgi:protein phosphatase
VSPANPSAAPAPLRFQLRSVGKTDVGRQRETNEDAVLSDERLGVFVVCDGMGGHASGQIASDLAVKTLAHVLRTGEPPSTPGEEPLVAALRAANAAVFRRGQSDPACHGMGTTAVGIRVEHDVMHVCHCGDSRLYLLRGGQLAQLTRDHSLANLYEDKPELRERMGPATSNVIVRAIGLDEHVEIDHRTFALEDGDLYLLCCDGLTDLVADWMIREIMTSGEPLDTIGENLVRAANANGGTDNITVILVAVHVEAVVEPPPEPTKPEREFDEQRHGTRPGF